MTTPAIKPISSTPTDDWAYSCQNNNSWQGKKKLEQMYTHYAKFYRALLKNYLPLDKNCTILDIPCGEGQMLYALKDLEYQNIEGFDLDEGRLASAVKLGLPARKGDAFDILSDCPEKTYDLIICMDFLEHLEKKQVVIFLQKIFTNISPNGFMLIRMPCANSLFGVKHMYNDFTHKWAATSGVLGQLLKAVGFRDIKVFGEKPNISMRYGLIRVILFTFSSFCINLLFRCLGHQPFKIWSSSMWAIARKK